MSSGGGFSGGGGGYSGGFGPPMGGFGQPMGGFGGFGGGFGQPFGGGFGFQPPQYGGGFGQPFGGGFQQPQYGGGFGFQPPQFGGFQNQGPGNAYARQNPYQPPAPPQFSQQPPPGMEQNPYYKPSNRYTDDVRISDMQYRPIQRANPATGVMPSEPISDPNYAPTGGGLPARPNDQFFGPVMTPTVEPQPATGTYVGESKTYTGPNALQDAQRDRVTRLAASEGLTYDQYMARDAERSFAPNQFSNYQNQQIEKQRAALGFGNPYGGFGGPYGGSPYSGMYSGLGGFFGGSGMSPFNQGLAVPNQNGNSSMNQQMMQALQSQRMPPPTSFNDDQRNSAIMQLAGEQGWNAPISGGPALSPEDTAARNASIAQEARDFLKSKNFNYNDSQLYGVYQTGQQERDRRFQDRLAQDRAQQEGRRKIEEFLARNPQGGTGGGLMAI